MEGKAAYIDLKFSRLKARYLGIRCLALVEVPQVDLDSLRGVIDSVPVHADLTAYHFTQFQTVIASEAQRSEEAEPSGVL